MLAYLQARIRSFGHALKGIGILLRTQPHARIHAVATMIVLISGHFLHLHRSEWIAVLLCIGLVWTAEALNTALEFLADEVDPKPRAGIGRAKDVAAAGVLIAALISVAVAALILWNHLH
jgi:diacylglycerol kinase (ATP)